VIGIQNPGMVIILLAGAITTIILSRDVMSSGRIAGIPVKRRGLLFFLYAIPCVALGVVLRLFLVSEAAFLAPGGNYPEAFVAMMPLVFYLILSSFALMGGSLISWPLRGTLKAHTVVCLLLIFLGLFALISADPSRRYLLIVAVLAGLLSALAARWQDASFEQLHQASLGRPADSSLQPLHVPPEETRVLPPAGPEIFPGDLLERYEDIRVVGAGGLARVFRARNILTGTDVALKIPIQADEATGRCFMKEIMGWEALQHPNIVRVSEVNILPVPYVEMEYIGRTLFDLPRPMHPGDAARIALGVARGLSFAHERGIIHRDIKPQNILITGEGTPKISDWGMSKVMGISRMPTVTGFSLGYAAPEQIDPGIFGNTDPRTDLYQLGVVLYELVTGNVPFPGGDFFEIRSRIATERPRPPVELQPGVGRLDSIIMKCLEKKPFDRYQTAAGLINDLEAYLVWESRDEYNIFED